MPTASAKLASPRVRKLLVSLRKEQGISTGQLADRLDAFGPVITLESHVIEYERDEYDGITVDRAAAVLAAVLFVKPSVARMLVGE